MYPLIDYLSEQRVALMKATHSIFEEEEDGQQMKTIIELCTFVDTTLLKAYYRLKSPMIPSLLRVQNYCDLEASESMMLADEVI